MRPVERYNHTYHHGHGDRQRRRRRNEKHDYLLILYSLRDGRSTENRARHHPWNGHQSNDTVVSFPHGGGGDLI